MGGSALGKTLVALGGGALIFIAAAMLLAAEFPSNAWYYLAGGK